MRRRRPSGRRDRLRGGVGDARRPARVRRSRRGNAVAMSATTPATISRPQGYAAAPPAVWPSRITTPARRRGRARRCGCGGRARRCAQSLPSSGTSSQQRDVEQQPGAAEEGEDHEGDAQDQRVDVEVTGETAGDTGDAAAVADRTPDARQVADLVPSHAGTGVRSRGRRRLGLGRCRAHGDNGALTGRRTPSGRPLIPRWFGGGRSQGCGRGSSSWSGARRSATMEAS